MPVGGGKDFPLPTAPDCSPTCPAPRAHVASNHPPPLRQSSGFPRRPLRARMSNLGTGAITLRSNLRPGVYALRIEATLYTSTPYLSVSMTKTILDLASITTGSDSTS